MSTITQWQNSTRGRLFSITVPSLLKFAREEGTSTSMQRSTRDFAPFGTSDQDSCGLRFWPSFMCSLASGMPKAQRAGMAALCWKEVEVSFIRRSGLKPLSQDRSGRYSATAAGIRAPARTPARTNPTYNRPMAHHRAPTKEAFSIPGPAGILEALLETPDRREFGRMAVICHPHPLHQGSMLNKVVHTVSRAMIDLGVPALRFNFRGVGASDGQYGDGVGETDDVLAACEWMRARLPGGGPAARRVLVRCHGRGQRRADRAARAPDQHRPAGGARAQAARGKEPGRAVADHPGRCRRCRAQ